MPDAAAGFEFDPSQLSEQELQTLPSLDDGKEPAKAPQPKVAHVVVPRADTGAAAAAPLPATSDAPAEAPAKAQTAAGRASLMKRLIIAPAAWCLRFIYTVLDRTLGILNLPLSRFSPRTRDTIGVIAAGTIVLALTSAILKPLLFPHADPVADLGRLLSATPEKPESAPPPAAHGSEH